MTKVKANKSSIGSHKKSQKLSHLFRSQTPHLKPNSLKKWKSPLVIESGKKKGKSKNLKGTGQLYLDFGQKVFDQKECSKCGMNYAPGVLSDEEVHRKYCKENSGYYRFIISPTMRIVKSFSLSNLDKEVMNINRIKSSQIHVLKFSASDNSNVLKKVLTLKKLKMDKEMGFIPEKASEWNPNHSAFVAIDAYKKCAVGCLIIERIENAVKVRVENAIFTLSKDVKPAILGVRQIWIEENYRRRGIANIMLDEARSRCIYGMCVPKEQVAMSQPTPQGYKFGSKYFGLEDFLVYELTHTLNENQGRN